MRAELQQPAPVAEVVAESTLPVPPVVPQIHPEVVVAQARRQPRMRHPEAALEVA